MRRSVNIAVAQLFAVVVVSISAAVANAQMKVACVGDSITAPSTGWCSHLGTKLGSGYMTRTFGVSGTTLLKNVGQPAFSSSGQFKPSQDYAPNIVVIMLGTNDSMPRNWNAGKDHFVADYEALIDSYQSLATKPMVFLNTVPPASDDNMFSISGTTIEKEINPLIKQVAMTKMVFLVDVWGALGGDVSKLSSFDGVHPGAAGQMLIADAVAKAIMSPMVPGGSAGMGGSAGAGGGSASPGGAGAGGQAGTNTAGTAGAITAGAAGANTSGAAGATTGAAGANAAAMAGSGAGHGAAGSGTIMGASGNTGSTSTPTKPGAAGSGGPANAAGDTGTAINPVMAAGADAPMVPDDSDGGCRMAGHSTTQTGPTAALLLLFALVVRSRRRTRS